MRCCSHSTLLNPLSKVIIMQYHEVLCPRLAWARGWMCGGMCRSEIVFVVRKHSQFGVLPCGFLGSNVAWLSELLVHCVYEFPVQTIMYSGT